MLCLDGAFGFSFRTPERLLELLFKFGASGAGPKRFVKYLSRFSAAQESKAVGLLILKLGRNLIVGALELQDALLQPLGFFVHGRAGIIDRGFCSGSGVSQAVRQLITLVAESADGRLQQPDVPSQTSKLGLCLGKLAASFFPESLRNLACALGLALGRLGLSQIPALDREVTIERRLRGRHLAV